MVWFAATPPPMSDAETVTTTVWIAVQLEADVPVTVYVVVEAGFAVTVAPLVVESPVEGDHVQVLAPEAVNSTLPPGAIEADDGEIKTLIEELIVADPVETNLKAAPVDEKLTFPEAPLVANMLVLI